MSDSSHLHPQPTVVPQWENGDIVIRQFLPKDYDQISALLDEGFALGPGSTGRAAARRSLSRPVAICAYVAFIFGSILSVYAYLKLSTPVLSIFVLVNGFAQAAQLAGVAICLASLATIVYLRYSAIKELLDYCVMARQSDLKDIMAYYRIAPQKAFVEEGWVPESPSARTMGPSGFWVAVIQSPYGEGADEVVGYVGLDYQLSNPTIAVIRRMIVSSKLRRRRLGSLLLNTVLAHAEAHSPPLTALELETSECQPASRALYEKFGFTVVGGKEGMRWMSLGALDGMKVMRFRRAVRVGVEGKDKVLEVKGKAVV
ncbi:acyl-CoA N-acyltransferase [Mycena amicta]|nr:acyl-CoA N-acyltransferase [Mycena amicta]